MQPVFLINITMINAVEYLKIAQCVRVASVSPRGDESKLAKCISISLKAKQNSRKPP